jgi:hypothetical protein
MCSPFVAQHISSWYLIAEHIHFRIFGVTDLHIWYLCVCDIWKSSELSSISVMLWKLVRVVAYFRTELWDSFICWGHNCWKHFLLMCRRTCLSTEDKVWIFSKWSTTSLWQYWSCCIHWRFVGTGWREEAQSLCLQGNQTWCPSTYSCEVMSLSVMCEHTFGQYRWYQQLLQLLKQ